MKIIFEIVSDRVEIVEVVRGLSLRSRNEFARFANFRVIFISV